MEATYSNLMQKKKRTKLIMSTNQTKWTSLVQLKLCFTCSIKGHKGCKHYLRAMNE